MKEARGDICKQMLQHVEGSRRESIRLQVKPGGPSLILHFRMVM